MGGKMLANWGLVVPLAGALLILAGCAGPMPKASPDEAWVSLREEPATTLMAETLDGQRLHDGRFFEVPAGKHRLGATLFVEGDGDSNGEICNASVAYDTFKAGGHYTLVESSLGQTYTLTLYNKANKELAQTSETSCMAG